MQHLISVELLPLTHPIAISSTPPMHTVTEVLSMLLCNHLNVDEHEFYSMPIRIHSSVCEKSLHDKDDVDRMRLFLRVRAQNGKFV